MFPYAKENASFNLGITLDMLILVTEKKASISQVTLYEIKHGEFILRAIKDKNKIQCSQMLVHHFRSLKSAKKKIKPFWPSSVDNMSKFNLDGIEYLNLVRFTTSGYPLSLHKDD